MKLFAVYLGLVIGFPSSLPLSVNRSPSSPHTSHSLCHGTSNNQNEQSLPPTLSSPFRIAVIGGGASGMFAAVTAASRIQQSPSSSSAGIVTVYEASQEVLRSVRISAGGRENVLFDPSTLKLRELLNIGYPRGKKEILSLLIKQFPPIKQQQWFEDRGVTFVTEKDGRMVAKSGESKDTKPLPSSTICDAILDEATKVGVQICTKVKINAISKNKDHFVIRKVGSNGNFFEEECCDCIILATGNSHFGFSLAKSFDHTIQRPLRSCFGFRSAPKSRNSAHTPSSRSKYKVPLSNISDGLHKIHHSRLTFKVKIPGQKRARIFKKEGPAEVFIRDDRARLVGMAAFNLASISAPQLKELNYSGTVLIHFCPDIGQVERVEDTLWARRQDKRYSNQRMGDQCPLVHEEVDYDNYDFETDTFPMVITECIPTDIWQNLCENCGATSNYKWSQMSPKKIRALADLVVGYEFEFEGKFTPEDEYVNAGGISLKEIDLSAMQSKLVDNLIFCGQVLDGDGSHGGFTFMRDFSSGLVAGETAASYATRNSSKVSVSQ
mmetsp:Transcript_25113/g.55077  ORF Transcript_25113/g.55077 Transcript_25113/m.55077 type:complete len:551 (-) Transcript_25113:284-1936(-)